MLNGKWGPYKSTGFGIVVVTRERDLIGYGKGTPPGWCSTASAAEAWALQTILTCSFPPQLRSGCLSLLRPAAEGTAKATEAGKPLARIWKTITHALDGNVTVLSTNCLLTWLPAHQTLATVGHRELSNGQKCQSWIGGPTDWLTHSRSKPRPGTSSPPHSSVAWTARPVQPSMLLSYLGKSRIPSEQPQSGCG